MKYHVIDIVNDEITEVILKEIINKKLYKIIEFMEFNVNLIK